MKPFLGPAGRFSDHHSKAQLIADVAPGGEMWVDYHGREKIQEFDWVRIHVRSTEDVSGSGQR